MSVGMQLRVVVVELPSWRCAVISRSLATEQSSYRPSVLMAHVMDASICSCGSHSLPAPDVTETTTPRSSKNAAAANRKLSSSNQSITFHLTGSWMLIIKQGCGAFWKILEKSPINWSGIFVEILNLILCKKFIGFLCKLLCSCCIGLLKIPQKTS